jgi:transcriptional regulator with XRE-family HTH domain
MLDGMALPEFRIPGWRDLERLAFEGRISMEELCRRAEVNSSTFRYWKSGRSTPSVATVQALLDAGLAAMAAAERAEQTDKPAPDRGRRKAAAKRAKSTAAKRPARRRA